MSVIILRGVSGAGKSTYISKREDVNTTIVSADFFFIDLDTKEYKFDGSKLPQAHAACLRDFINACDSSGNEQKIYVDNTNTTVAELAPYVAIAAAYGHDCEIVTVRADTVAAAERNLHGVPLTGVIAQANRLAAAEKDFAPWWKHTVVE